MAAQAKLNNDVAYDGDHCKLHSKPKSINGIHNHLINDSSFNKKQCNCSEECDLEQTPNKLIINGENSDTCDNGIVKETVESNPETSALNQDEMLDNDSLNESGHINKPTLNKNTVEEALEKLTLNEIPTNCPTRVRAEDVGDNIISASDGICYARYKNEMQMPAIMHLITKDLSEPYSIYTYRYFIHNWPHLCYLAIHDCTYVGAIVCKLDLHKKISRRGYIAMLAVDESVRRKNIGTNLVKMAIEAMTEDGCDEVVLETEVTNHSALRLYEKLGFVRDKRLFRYYLNGVDALRLKLWLC